MTSRHIDRQFVICLHLQIVLGLAELATMLHVIIVMVSYNVETLIQRNAADDLGFLLLHDILDLLCVVGPRFATTQNYDKSQSYRFVFRSDQ